MGGGWAWELLYVTEPDVTARPRPGPPSVQDVSCRFIYHRWQMPAEIGRRNALSHNTGTDNSHIFNAAPSLMGCDLFFVAIGKKEHVQQRAIYRGAEEFGHFLRFQFSGVLRIE